MHYSFLPLSTASNLSQSWRGSLSRSGMSAQGNTTLFLKRCHGAFLSASNDVNSRMCPATDDVQVQLQMGYIRICSGVARFAMHELSLSE